MIYILVVIKEYITIKIQSITSVSFNGKTATIGREVVQAAKKDCSKLDRQYSWEASKVMEYLHTVRSGIGFHAPHKEPVIALNTEKIAHESSEVMLAKIRCENTNDMRDIDSTMGLYGLQMYSGLPFEDMCFYDGGYVETLYEKGKSIATTLREFLFKNRSGYVDSVQNRFGKCGEMILDEYRKTGAVRIWQQPMSYHKSYRVVDDFYVNDKRYYGMAILEKASQMMVDSDKKA